MSEHTQMYSKKIDERRYRGFLTQRDAQHLETENSKSREQTTDIRYRIRERTKSAIRDLGFLANQLDPPEFELIFSDLVEEQSGHELNLLIFLYCGLTSLDDMFEEADERTLELYIRAAIQQAESLKNNIANPSVDLDVNRLTDPAEQVRNELLSGTGGLLEFQYLQREGELRPLLEAIIDRDQPLLATPEHETVGNRRISLTVSEAENLLNNLSEDST